MYAYESRRGETRCNVAAGLLHSGLEIHPAPRVSRAERRAVRAGRRLPKLT